MEQLREMLWLEHTYNLILLGPPGVGKTHLSVGLGMEAMEHGHRVSFVAMDDLIHLLNTQEITRTSQVRMNRILHISEVTQLSGDSFRLKHRETIFQNNWVFKLIWRNLLKST